MAKATASLPRLHLRLPGTWVQLDPRRPALTTCRIRDFVEIAMGRADELAMARASMRSSLEAMIVDDPPEAALESVFVCHEIARGIPTPLAVAVFAPGRVRMSPAMGTEAASVIGAFLDAMEALGERGRWEMVPCADGRAARTWREVERVVAAGLEDVPLRTFVADYWRTVPGSKRLVLITVTSPLVDIPLTMLHLADAIVGGSRFGASS